MRNIALITIRMNKNSVVVSVTFRAKRNFFSFSVNNQSLAHMKDLDMNTQNVYQLAQYLQVKLYFNNIALFDF
jgi:hypothetical protein